MRALASIPIFGIFFAAFFSKKGRDDRKRRLILDELGVSEDAPAIIPHAISQPPSDRIGIGIIGFGGEGEALMRGAGFAHPDWTEQMKLRAQENPRNLLNGGRPIARFTRRNDPTSLRFARGYEPDFGRGIVEVSTSYSGLYGGRLRRFRIVSKNRLAQYLFLAGRRQAWVASCQATTTEIMSYGVRTIDALSRFPAT